MWTQTACDMSRLRPQNGFSVLMRLLPQVSCSIANSLLPEVTESHRFQRNEKEIPWKLEVIRRNHCVWNAKIHHHAGACGFAKCLANRDWVFEHPCQLMHTSANWTENQPGRKLYTGPLHWCCQFEAFHYPTHIACPVREGPFICVDSDSTLPLEFGNANFNRHER